MYSTHQPFRAKSLVTRRLKIVCVARSVGGRVARRVLPLSWVAWALDSPGENGRRQPTVAELAACDGESTMPRKAQHKLGKVVNKIKLDNFTGHLPEEERFHPRKTTPLEVARPRTWPQRECGAHKDQGHTPFLERYRRSHRTNSSTPRDAPWGVEEYLAPGCPRCHRGRDGGTITTMHARTCPRDGAQVNMHESLNQVLRTIESTKWPSGVESGAPFTGDQNLSMGIVIRTGALANASSPEYRNKRILLDVTHADPQAQVHLRNGSATSDGTAAQTSEARKRQHYARPGHVSFYERSFKLTTLAVERPPWRGGLRVHRRTSDACRRRERLGIDGAERGLQGTTSPGSFRWLHM